MKKKFMNPFLLSMMLAVPVSVASGQEGKTEKRVKIVIEEGDGTKTVLDTTITGGEIPGIIKMKNGQIILSGDSEIDIEPEKDNMNVHVFISEDEDGEKKHEEEIIIRNANDATWTALSTVKDKEHIYVISNNINNDITENESNKTKYIIASDGVVVTVESDDEVKARELINDIRNKLGVKEKE